MATRVVHVRKEPFDVYIGRACKEFSESLWHNPFQLGFDGTRKAVLQKYRDYLSTRPDLIARLHELRGLTLGCWCKPKYACHGDILAELADITDSHSIS
jgi:hypothetical protein